MLRLVKEMGSQPGPPSRVTGVLRIQQTSRVRINPPRLEFTLAARGGSLNELRKWWSLVDHAASYGRFLKVDVLVMFTVIMLLFSKHI